MGRQMGMNKKLVVGHELGSLLQTTQSVEAAEETTREATTKALQRHPSRRIWDWIGKEQGARKKKGSYLEGSSHKSFA